jgi:hypothetical protein
LGAYGEFDPSPESIESDVLAFLKQKHGSTFEIDSIEREGFAHDVCVLFAHPAGDPDALVRVEWSPRTGGISESSKP